jgi:uncharacterized protein
MPRVIHFEIPASAPEKAVKFYSGVFGWKINKWAGPQDYWLIDTGSEGTGINGAITRESASMSATVNTIGVPSFDDFTKKITENGGKILTPKMTVPGVGYMAYCQDTEGNMFGIMQEDPKAK